MSDSAVDIPGPRRSQRERKTVKAFVSVPSSARKRKRPDGGTDNEGSELEGEQGEQEREADDEDDEEPEDEEEVEPKPKPAKKTKPKGSPKGKAPAAPRKSREPKPAVKRVPKAMTRGRRKPKDGEDVYDADQVTKDTRIASDNPLFNAIMNPAAALQSTVEDFLESLEQSPDAAQAELINLFLRSCGCNDTVSSDDAVDYDGVVDSLDNITEALKQDNSPTYPLTSKLPVFKKFRRSLSEFVERLITSAAELGLLYSTGLMSTLQTWVVAMSSSQIRSFRHTATVVALEVETALCEVAAAVEKEAQVVGRQREGEKKRKGASKGANARDKELQAKAQEIRERRKKLAEYLKEFVDGVFVHRYRDLDPSIRGECVKAIGLWFKKYPGHFLDGAYLRYVGWVLSDSNTHVRLEAVRSLSGVYEKNDYIGSLNHFTERFKPRLLEMATSDTELPVRVAVIQVLGSIDGHSLLDEEEREKLCLLVYDEEAKVRKAVSQFVHNVWEESVEEIIVGKSKLSDLDQTRTGIKALAALLVKWCKALDELEGDGDEELEDGVDDAASRTSRRGRRKEIWSLIGNADHRGRTALAVEALWEDVDCLQNWEEILNLILLDHSTGDSNGRVNGHSRDPESRVDNIWRLEEEQETILLEVLVASIRKLKAEAAAAKKAADEENLLNNITRAFIKALPRLFIKYQADPYRISEVLILPSLLNLELYLEMRMITAYSNLWDDIIKQFMSYSSMGVLSNAIDAISRFMATTSLSNTNSTKILELEDELSSALHDAVVGRDEIEIASFTEDEVLSLAAICTRVSVLIGARNLSAWVDEDEGGKQSSAWNIISAIADRGRLGYKEEETMVEQALNVLTLHTYWKARGLLVASDPNGEDNRYKDILLEQREILIDKLKDYAVGNQSNTVEGVKRAAFKHLLNLHILFSPDQPLLPDGSPSPIANVGLVLDDEIQYRCTGYIQAEIERYADALEEADPVEKSNPVSEDEEHSEKDDASAKGKGKQRETSAQTQVTNDPNSRAMLEREYLFVDVLTTFLRAIRIGAINIKHGSIFLAHYGRLGSAVDACAKVIIDMLKDEGMHKGNGDIVVEIATRSVEEAFTLVLDGIVPDELEAVQLAKLLSQCFVLRGSQLSVLRRLDPQYVVTIHTNLLTWIAKRLSIYEHTKNKKLMKVGLLFFKVLAGLAPGLQSGDALKIKAHMDQAFEQSQIEVPSTGKNWDAQRNYEKRLDGFMTKEKGSARARRSGKRKTGAANDAMIEDESEVENMVREPVKPTPRPRPTRVTRSNPFIETEPADEEEPAQSREPSPLSDVAHRKASEIDENEGSNALEEVEMRSTRGSTPERPGPEDDQQTPKSSLKRSRPDENDVGGDEDGAAENPDVETTPVNDLKVRRKRMRH